MKISDCKAWKRGITNFLTGYVEFPSAAWAEDGMNEKELKKLD